jgi:hypothetical protein
VAFPLRGAGKPGNKDATIAVIRDSGEVAFGVSVPGAAFQEGSFFRQFGFQINRGGHVVFLI